MLDKDEIFENHIWSDLQFGEKINNEEIKQFVYSYMKNIPDGSKKSNYGGYQSYDLPPNNVPESFRHLISCVTNSINQVADYYRYHPLVIANTWFNVNPINTYNLLHTHPQSILSGAYYVQCESDTDDEMSGRLFFERSDGGENHIQPESMKEINMRNGMSFSAKVQTGSLYIFHSWIPHHVSINKKNYDRISISFNAITKTNDHW